MQKVTIDFESGTRATFYPQHERVVFDFVSRAGVRCVDLSFAECLRVMAEIKQRREAGR
jgi:hypothetical protein